MSFILSVPGLRRSQRTQARGARPQNPIRSRGDIRRAVTMLPLLLLFVGGVGLNLSAQCDISTKPGDVRLAMLYKEDVRGR